MLSCLIYSLTERKLWDALREKMATVHDQRRKPIQTPTICWVFQLFEGLDILLVRQNGQVILHQLLNLSTVQKQVIALLVSLVQNCYLFNSKVLNEGYTTIIHFGLLTKIGVRLPSIAFNLSVNQFSIF